MSEVVETPTETTTKENPKTTKETVQKAIAGLLGVSPDSLEEYFAGVTTPEEKKEQEEIAVLKLQEEQEMLSPKGIKMLREKEEALQTKWMEAEKAKVGHSDAALGLVVRNFYKAQYLKHHPAK